MNKDKNYDERYEEALKSWAKEEKARKRIVKTFNCKGKARRKNESSR